MEEIKQRTKITELQQAQDNLRQAQDYLDKVEVEIKILEDFVRSK